MATNYLENKAAATPETAAPFKGYTLDNLRYRRALVALQREFNREKIINSLQKVQSASPFSRNFTQANSTSRRIGVIANKLTGGLNYLDYILLGFTVAKSGKRIYDILTGRFRRKK